MELCLNLTYAKYLYITSLWLNVTAVSKKIYIWTTRQFSPESPNKSLCLELPVTQFYSPHHLWGTGSFRDGQMVLNREGWKVLSITYCLLTDALFDLYLWAVHKVPIKMHSQIWRKLIPFDYELDVDLFKQQFKQQQ